MFTMEDSNMRETNIYPHITCIQVYIIPEFGMDMVIRLLSEVDNSVFFYSVNLPIHEHTQCNASLDSLRHHSCTTLV